VARGRRRRPWADDGEGGTGLGGGQDWASGVGAGPAMKTTSAASGQGRRNGAGDVGAEPTMGSTMRGWSGGARGRRAARDRGGQRGAGVSGRWSAGRRRWTRAQLDKR
jgi:hypothetical protein